ncbi:tRNA (adenine(22)-N(1))-methyltransferase [Companilactobacillus metriopterae]|uniref:tRNA (adenine(22)-N(1))-methyltransferase n=1 Tax=Companilactobacillus metriopterae TaxID=1909267 RepID=UPI00100C0008|nr:class I SAM-dependent methyltransferase [Companilactobacillus metriopterae]
MELLSNRLKSVYDMVDPESRVADIGSDHAYIPIELVQNNIIDFAIAGEVVEGPMNISKQHVENFGLSNKIQVRLGNGLDVILGPDLIDTVIIAGMGGILIENILSKSTSEQLENVKNLILQPNIGEPLVRKWLSENNFEIIDENIINEDNHTYEIIKAKKIKNPKVLSESELLMGPILSKTKKEAFISKWSRKLESYEKSLKNIQRAKNIDQDKVNQITNNIELVKEVLK